MNDSAKNIVMFGGTFDPWSSAHQEIVERLALKYDNVIVVPTNINYYKKNTQMFSYEERFDFARENTKSIKNVEVLDIERNVDRDWRFIDSLKLLISKYGPSNNYFVAMGADCLQALKTWYNWQEIPKLASIVVFTRPGYETNVSDIPYTTLPMNNSISSTQLRKELSKSDGK